MKLSQIVLHNWEILFVSLHQIAYNDFEDHELYTKEGNVIQDIFFSL
jgi:hypothetical protein